MDPCSRHFTTKLYIPPAPPPAVLRPRLVARLNAGLQDGPSVVLISAAAGSGKTTLVSEWNQQDKDEVGRMKYESGHRIHTSSFLLHPFRIAWLSLDEGDNDPARFLAYLVSALQTIAPASGRVLGALSAPQPLPIESILTSVLNDLARLADPFVLVLDDYHVLEAPAVTRPSPFCWSTCRRRCA